MDFALDEHRPLAVVNEPGGRYTLDRSLREGRPQQC